MLIIFDLDDTLIDTMGSILPHRHREFLQKIDRAGDLDRFGKLDAQSESSKEAIESFFAGNENLIATGISTIYGREDFPFSIALTPGVKESLVSLSQEHKLAIVTYGKTAAQEKKIEKAGLDRDLFSSIVVCEDPAKGPHYKTIFEKYGEERNDVIVCGDRIERDLRPAKELGFTTVLMRWGRGKTQRFDPLVVDHEIDAISALLRMNCLR